MGTNTLTHRPAGTGGPPASRRGYLDVLRCLAIFLVIALHCTAGQIVRPELFGTRTWLACDIVNGFARMGVPLFFMISGFLLLSSGKTDDIRGFYIHRFSKLLPPFLFWDVLYYFETCAAGGQAPGLLPFLQELTGQGSKYHLWFIYQIAGLYLLMPFLKKILDHSTRREQLAFLAVVLLQPTIFRFLNIIQRTVTFSPFRALVEGYAGFVLLGYLLGSCQIPKRGRMAIYAVGLLGLGGCIVGNFLTSSPEEIVLYFNAGYSITHYMSAGALFLLVKECAERIPAWALRRAASLSGRTFGIYFIHVLILDLYGAALGRLGLAPGAGLRIAGSFVFVSAVSVCAVYVLSKIPLLRRVV